MKEFKNLVLDEERALYAKHDAKIINCKFSGIADGESALKECKNITVKDCVFKLRYPLWHADMVKIINCRMTETCRAALWYDKNISIKNCEFRGIKVLRECNGIVLDDSYINSTEFAWLCRGLKLNNSVLTSEYPFFMSKDMDINKLKMFGKYSFQYVEDSVIYNSNLDTKDAFWHCKNVTVYDSVLKGEYLAWYSENLRLVRCKIIGTQPLCYAKGLVLKDCEMIDCDLAFEYSQLQADINGEILSVKNPLNGYIKANKIREIVIDENQDENSDCNIILK